MSTTHDNSDQAARTRRSARRPNGVERTQASGTRTRARPASGETSPPRTLRKACGSLLLAQGKNLKQVQGWLRHSQLTTTLNVYIHETDDGLGGARVWGDILGATWGHRGATCRPETGETCEDAEPAEITDLQAKIMNGRNLPQVPDRNHNPRVG